MDGEGRRGFDSMTWFWVMLRSALGGLVTLEQAQALRSRADLQRPPA
jgi:hypothetical protein